MTPPDESVPRARLARSRAGLSWLLAGALVLLDQASKLWATQQLPPGEAIAFLPGLLQLRLVRNSGAAFSLFTGWAPLLAVISLLVCGAVALVLLRRPPNDTGAALALGFLLGGAAGNGIDRWRLGAVIDFLEIVPIQFPVFNLADVAINLAVLCFALDALAALRREGSRDA
jgi:signal peptidase II